MEQRLIIGIMGGMLIIADKEQQSKIYKWFVYGNDPIGYVFGINSYSVGIDKKDQEFIVNRNCVAFMTFEDKL